MHGSPEMLLWRETNGCVKDYFEITILVSGDNDFDKYILFFFSIE